MERSECKLELSSINTFYGESHILNNVSMMINQGEVVGLLGRNGVGKTTTLYSIMGIVKPRSGSITFEGKSILGLETYEIARMGIGLVPEDRRIFPNLTVRENLLMGMNKQLGKEGSNNGWSIDKIYEYIPMLKRLDSNKGAYLSGGEKQMLSIGRALMGNPTLLLLDEPMEGLAPITTNEVSEIIKEINKWGISILLVEGSMKNILRVCKRVYIMLKGMIVFEGSTTEFKDNIEVQKKYLEV